MSDDFNWPRVCVKKLAKVIRGSSPRPKGDPRYYGGTVPRLMVSDITRDGKYVTAKTDFLTIEGAKLSRPMQAGSLIVVCSGTVGVPSILASDACIHDGFLALKNLSSNCDTEFLYYSFLQQRSRFDTAATHGGIFTNLTTTIFKDFELDLPPLPEQRKIARILTTVDNLIEKTEALIEKQKSIKQGMMHDLFTRGVDAGGKLRPPFEEAPHLYKESKLGWIPKEWEVEAIANFCGMRSGGTPSRSQHSRYFKDGKIPWVKTMDLNEDEIIETDEQITDAALNESSCSLLATRTVMVAMYGGFLQIGRTAILAQPSATNQAICSIQPNPDQLGPQFLLRYLQYARFRWRSVAMSTRKDPNITKADIARFLIAMPLQLEQQGITARIDRINNLISVEQRNCVALSKIKTGLMQDLLTGKVRVNVDEAEEVMANV